MREKKGRNTIGVFKLVTPPLENVNLLGHQNVFCSFFTHTKRRLNKCCFRHDSNREESCRKRDTTKKGSSKMFQLICR